MAYHVLPIDDLREHEESPACWCQPTVQTEDSETGEPYRAPLVVHNSLDGRELVEQHGIN